MTRSTNRTAISVATVIPNWNLDAGQKSTDHVNPNNGVYVSCRLVRCDSLFHVMAVAVWALVVNAV